MHRYESRTRHPCDTRPRSAKPWPGRPKRCSHTLATPYPCSTLALRHPNPATPLGHSRAATLALALQHPCPMTIPRPATLSPCDTLALRQARDAMMHGDTEPPLQVVGQALSSHRYHSLTLRPLALRHLASPFPRHKARSLPPSQFTTVQFPPSHYTAPHLIRDHSTSGLPSAAKDTRAMPTASTGIISFKVQATGEVGEGDEGGVRIGHLE